MSEDRNGVSWSSGVDGYGSVAVKFKPTVRERTSWVGDDSFWLASAPDVIEDGTGRLVFLPSSVAKPSAASLGKKDAIHFFRRREGDAPFSPSRTSSYWEAQVHGGVTLDDIDEVIFYHRNEFEMWSPKLREAGIRHRFDPYQETVQHSKHAMGTEKLLAEVERDRAVFDAEFARVGGAYLPRVINGKIEDQRQSQIDAALADFREADTPDRFVKLSSLDPKLAKEALEERSAPTPKSTSGAVAGRRRRNSGSP